MLLLIVITLPSDGNSIISRLNMPGTIRKQKEGVSDYTFWHTRLLCNVADTNSSAALLEFLSRNDADKSEPEDFHIEEERAVLKVIEV